MIQILGMDKDTKMGIITISIAIPILSLFVWNSDNSSFQIESTENKEKLVAVASFYPIYDFTKQVGGEKVDVSSFVPAGVEPHDFDPTIRDIEQIQSADVLIINGIGFEHWLEKLEAVTSDSSVTLIDSSNGVSAIERHTIGEIEELQADDHSTDLLLTDPHIWLNPIFAKIQVENIAEGLIESDPQNSDHYRENANKYLLKLDLLDFKIQKELSTCTKDFIAFHKAFSYFADHYGLIQHTINSNNPHGEGPTPRTLEDAIRLSQELGIHVIFSEEGVDPRTSDVIAREINGKVLILSPLEIFDDNSSYIQKMEQNLSNLKVALCK